MRSTTILFLTMMCAAAAAAQTRKTVLVITDAEGVAGICRQDQTDPKSPELRELLTGEVNAAVDGFYAGGADEVIVWDGHAGSETLSALTIHPRAKLRIGAGGSKRTFDNRYSAVAFVGQHPHVNRRGGVMAHSYWSLGIQNLLMNGKQVGEIETVAALAGVYDTPVIFLSGDQAAADDLRAIVPNAEVAVVKQGFSNYTCLTLSAQAARDLIREGATRAMKGLDRVKPYRLEGPVTIQVEYTPRNVLGIDPPSGPGIEVLDGRTVRYSGKDFLEAWTRSKM
jgi:D-amino peptidase